MPTIVIAERFADQISDADRDQQRASRMFLDLLLDADLQAVDVGVAKPRRRRLHAAGDVRRHLGEASVRFDGDGSAPRRASEVALRRTLAQLVAPVSSASASESFRVPARSRTDEPTSASLSCVDPAMLRARSAKSARRCVLDRPLGWPDAGASDEKSLRSITARSAESGCAGSVQTMCLISARASTALDRSSAARYEPSPLASRISVMVMPMAGTATSE